MTDEDLAKIAAIVAAALKVNNSEPAQKRGTSRRQPLDIAEKAKLDALNALWVEQAERKKQHAIDLMLARERLRRDRDAERDAKRAEQKLAREAEKELAKKNRELSQAAKEAEKAARDKQRQINKGHLKTARAFLKFDATYAKHPLIHEWINEQYAIYNSLSPDDPVPHQNAIWRNLPAQRKQALYEAFKADSGSPPSYLLVGWLQDPENPAASQDPAAARAEAANYCYADEFDRGLQFEWE
jgi:hypothetical protein